MSIQNYNYLFKYIIIGDSAVGKSNILLRYVQDRFNEEFQSTIGVEFGTKNIEIKNKICKIQIWDTAGQESFRSITRAYYKNSVCACIVYDITNRNSFQNVQQWIEDCKKQTPKTVLLVLIGNKLDLEKNREISYEEGESLALNNDMLFFETSAKTGENVEELFNKSAQIIVENIDKDLYDLSNDTCGIKIGNNSGNIILNKNKANEKNNNSRYCCYYF